MAQPQYQAEDVEQMSDVELAEELIRWADVRRHVSIRRATRNKLPLDDKLLREAARRLHHIGENCGGRS